MKKIMSRNELFKIVLVTIYDAGEDAIKSHYELIEEPNRTVDIFDSYSMAEQVMRQKTEFWKTVLAAIPQYLEVRFTA